MLNKIKSDAILAKQMDTLMKRIEPTSAILVSDGADDEFIYPILASRIEIDAIKRVVVKQTRNIESIYYKAILQNLFFATLNVPMDEREFRVEKRYKGKNKDYMNHLVFRYANLFLKENCFKELFGEIPFLNGGLFDCLDFLQDGFDSTRYEWELREAYLKFRLPGDIDLKVGRQIRTLLPDSPIAKEYDRIEPHLPRHRPPVSDTPPTLRVVR